MKNALFDAESLEILLAPPRWRIVSSLFAPEVRAVRDPERLAWMGAHVDQHPRREILIALRGQGVYGFKGQAYSCPPGTVILFGAQEPHDNYYPPDSPPLRHLWLYLFGGTVMARLLDVGGRRGLVVGKPSWDLGDDDACRLLIASWDELLVAPHLPESFKRAKLVAALAATLARIVGSGYAQSSASKREDFSTAVMQTIQRHVEQHAGRGIPLGEAARLAGYSKYHFHRIFKRHSGKTYHAFVDACRIKRARDLLVQGRRQREIAAELGFSHPSAYLRWMKLTARGASGMLLNTPPVPPRAPRKRRATAVKGRSDHER